MLPQKIIKRSKINFKQLKKLLFEGKIEQLSRRIKKLYDLRKNSKTMKKLHSYFLPNQKRMQYKSFQERKLPIGSGVVESAIRRVINLRLKAPGSFWKLGFAEIIIFLRAQVLYGRWQNLLKNWIAKLLPEFHSVKTQILCKRKAA